MARLFSKAFYNSKVWQDARDTYISGKFGICERCGSPNAKQVHHKIYLNETNINNPEISLNPENFELLCEICHQNEHNEKYGVTQADLMFNEAGEIVKRVK